MTMDEIRRAQAAHRRKLVDTWEIPAGARILEIGCGQGDTTVALAEAIGPKGFVLSVDRAGREYGAPQTLGEATAEIKAGPLGGRIEFRLDFDLRRRPEQVERFDLAVMAHSSWYFGSSQELAETLAILRRSADRLGFAEWDLEPRSFEQVPHMLAVLIQGQVAALNTDSTSNVRTPLGREAALKVIGEAGWSVLSVREVDASALQDADWEIQACLKDAICEAMQYEASQRVLEALTSQVCLLRQLARAKGNVPLTCYSALAE